METKVLNHQADFMVKFPDGTLISRPNEKRFATYKAVIQKIGLPKVATFASLTKIRRHGEPYVNKNKNEKLIQKGYEQEIVDGYWVVNDFSVPNMVRFLRDLSIYYDLGLTIYNPCKEEINVKIK